MAIYQCQLETYNVTGEAYILNEFSIVMSPCAYNSMFHMPMFSDFSTVQIFH